MSSSVAPLPTRANRAVRPAMAPAGSHWRPLMRYLLLPRPGDTAKWVIIPMSYVLGSLATEWAASAGLARALIVWLAVEYLVYQARYQWNDINGLRSDQQHPDQASRGRLPGSAGHRRSVCLSAAVALMRIILAVAIAVLLAGWVEGPLLIASSVAILLVGALYESLRTWGTGRAGAGQPVGMGPAALWVVIGMGYAVRGLTGLGLAIDLPSHLLIATAACITLWATGTAFVTSRWAVESLAFAEVTAEGRVTWRASASQAREHIVGLSRWMPSYADSVDSLRTWVPLAPRSPIAAPWNLAFCVALPASAVLGAALAEGGRPAGSAAALMAEAVAAGVIAGLLVRRGRALLAVPALLAMAALFAMMGSDRPWLAVLPMALVCAIHILSMRQCLEDIGCLTHRLGRLRPSARPRGSVQASGPGR